MYIIGITGGTGAGKSSAVKALQTLGALVLDCDEIYHKLLSSNDTMRAEIETHFSDVLTDGKIDRHKLSKIVWNDPNALNELNMITHKYVSSEIERLIDEFKVQGGEIAVIDAIALIESGQGDKCDIVIAITAPQDKRIERIMKRDSLTREYASARINAQQPEDFYRDNSNYLLENIYNTQAEFEEKCKEFFNALLSK